MGNGSRNGAQHATVSAAQDSTSTKSYPAALHALWPEPCQVRRRTRGDRPRGGDVELLALPSVNHARFLLPRDPARIAAAAIRRGNTGASRLSHLKSYGLSVSARAGLLGRVGPRIVISEPDGETTSVRHHLRTLMGEEVHIAIYLGAKRAVQKPVLQVISGDGNLVAFAKIGIDDFTNHLVRREARNLRLLRTSDLDRDGFLIPEILHEGTWENRAILVERPLPRGKGGGAPRPVIQKAIRNIARVQGTYEVSLASSIYCERLLSRVKALRDSSHARTLRHFVEAFAHDERALSFGSWHGDFAPWNMTHDGGSLSVWDWEHFDGDVPVGFDALHFYIQSAVVMRKMQPARAFERLLTDSAEILRPFRVAPNAAYLTALLYVSEIATRYVEDDEPAWGTALGSLDWLEHTIRSARKGN